LYTKFNENPAVGLAAATRPHMDLHVRYSYFTLKEWLMMQFGEIGPALF